MVHLGVIRQHLRQHYQAIADLNAVRERGIGYGVDKMAMVFIFQFYLLAYNLETLAM